MTLGLRTVSADISRDEQIHVATNSLVCRELGLNHSNSLDKLRKATMSWMLEPLPFLNDDKFLSKKFWADSSDRLMYEGKAPQLSVTKSARMPSFFEQVMSTSLSTLEVFGMEARAVLNELDELFPPVTPGPTDSIEYNHVSVRSTLSH